MSLTRKTLSLWLAATLAASPALAEPSVKSIERSRQKEAAEEERAELRKKLATLKEDIGRTEKARGHAADALATSEAAISNANRSLRELAAEQERTTKRLEKLSVSQEALEAEVGQQRNRLEKILRGQYVGDQDDKLRLLLSGDNPNRIARELRYLGYVSAEQSKAIEALKQNLAAIEANKLDAEEARNTLQDIADEQREQKALLEKEKNKRKALLSQLSTQLSAQRKQAGNLARDEERLSSLLEKLTLLIAQQRKAEEEEAKRRARAKAEQKQAKTRATEKSVAKSDSTPTQAAIKAEPEPDQPPAMDASGFASMKGKLKLPVKGELVAGFGARRADGPNWKGLFIKAAEGAEVKAVEKGEVIFADWLRGFGNLLVVDHGGQYMTIYGKNQSLLKRPGDKLRAGDIIATVGNSGGNEQSGLYFEMRYQGRAIDPSLWMNR
ncbi:MAG: murein hydrolase activator EnvC family protein [bacterium]